MRDWLPPAVLFGYALPALALFALWPGVRARAGSARLASLSASPYLPRALMVYGYWVFSLPVGVLARVGVSPHAVTAASLGVTCGGAVAVAAGWLALGGWLLLLGFALDAWDGMLARRLGCASARGELLDAVVDRYGDLISLLAVLWFYRDFAPGAALAAAALVGATLVSYVRAKGEAALREQAMRQGHRDAEVDAKGGWMQRHERALYLGLGAMCAPLASRWLEPGAPAPRHYLLLAALALVALTSNVTALWRARWVWRRLGDAP